MTMTGRDFDDSLDGMFDGAARPVQERLPDTRTNEQKLAEVLERSANAPAVFNERCPKCGGSGFWKNSRRFPCFACKGKGTLSFKTSPEARGKARARATEKRIEREADKQAWRDQHAAEIAWLKRAAARNEERGGTFTFPASLLEKLNEYGTLLDGPLLKVQELMQRDEARKAEWQAKRSSTIDASKIEAAFAAAREKAARPGALGMWTKPLTLRGSNADQSFKLDLTFQPGSVGSEFEGMIFVRSGEHKLGWIKNGTFTRRGDCNDQEADLIKRVCEDPHAAANAHAKAWGRCGICGHTLTLDESIARGIGPICAGKYGWA